MNTEWVFVIKTDKYAGNFERDICAYCTGMVGECGVGGDYARRFYEDMGLVGPNFDWKGLYMNSCAEDLENPFCLYVEKKPDHHGCCRPVAMGDTNNDVFIFFKKEPTDKMLDLMKRRALKFDRLMISKYQTKDIHIKEFSLITFTTKREERKIK